MPPRSEFSQHYAPVAAALFAWARLRVMGVLRRRLDPEDVVQETLVRAYDRFEVFDPKVGSFRGWMFGIANNVLRELLTERARKPAPAVGAGDILDLIPADATSISRRAARSEEMKRVISVLEGLDEADQRFFAYRILEELDLAEVARTLGITEAAAEKRWQRLQPRLADLLEPFRGRLGR